MQAASVALAAGRARAQPSTHPFQIKGLNHISLAVSSLERSLEFYQVLFDLHVYTRQDGGRLPILTIGPGPQFIALTERRTANGGVGHHFCLTVEGFDLDQIAAALEGLGVEARTFPWTYQGTRYEWRPAAAQRPRLPGDHADTPELVFTDPDGVLLQIQDVTYCGGVGRLGDVCGIPSPWRPTRTAPLAARTLNHVSIPVTNVERSLSYYQRVFGLEHSVSQAKGTVPVLPLGGGPEHIVLTQGPSEAAHHFCLGIEGFEPDRVMRTLTEHGIDARSRLRRATDQRPQGPAGADTPEIIFEDPDGHVVQLQDPRHCGGVGPLGDVCP